MRKLNRVSKVIIASGLTLGMFGTIAAPMSRPVTVYANSKEAAPIAKSDLTTPNGIANFGGGSASITINAYNGQSLVGKQFEVYKLFNAENADGMESINYTFNEEYKLALQTLVGKKLNKEASKVTEYDVIDYIQTLNTHKIEGAQSEQEQEGRYSEFRYFVEELRDTMKELKMNGTLVNVTQTDVSGNIHLQGLDYGYYIIDETSATEGTHSASSLCIVNTANPDADVQVKSDYPSIIKKINEDDNEVGWNDIADYEIGQTVPYRYQTNVPNMNGYHTYFFAFHDKMDKALSFQKDTVSIIIKNADKEYTLKANEFNTIVGGNDETFRVEIPDLKAIVDREFPEGMNDDGENVYGQMIELYYNATLNDYASEDTGRPGFENNVRLEFSNDPDSDGDGETGYTPWDTVVCFTFKINGLKINNHNKTLEGAKFRLYSDAECTNEVYVKASDHGYIVINRDSVGGDDHTGGTQPSEAVEMVSDENGVFTILGLDQGTYWLKETDSPAGYRELLDPIEITLTPTYISDRNIYVAGEGATDKILQKLDATAHIKEFYDGAFSEKDIALDTNEDEGAANITVVNQVGSKLPITGSNGTVIMLAAGVAIMAVAGGYAYSKRKKGIKE